MLNHILSVMRPTIHQYYMKAFLLGLATLSIYWLSAQQTGTFQSTITFNAQPRILEYSVPLNYNHSDQHPLVVGLHGCIGGSNPASGFRNEIAFLSDSIGAIVVCPNGLTAFAGMMDNFDHPIIIAALDSAMATYNIDPSRVYLIGFSCNGYVTAKYGTQEIYPWKGIIPFNAALNSSDSTNGLFDYTNQTSTCICVGSNDPGLSLSQQLRDSLAVNGASYYYNEIPGVGHVTMFPTFPAEVMECFDSFNVTVQGTSYSIRVNGQVKVYPNPTSDIATFTINGLDQGSLTIYDLSGSLLHKYTLTSEQTVIPVDMLTPGTYLWQIINDRIHISAGRLVVM